MSAAIPRFAATAAAGDDPNDVVTRAASAIAQQLDGTTPTLVAVFASPRLLADPWEVLEALHQLLHPTALLGAMSEAPIGGGHEYEDRPALALWAAVLPGVTPVCRHLTIGPDGERPTVGAWQQELSQLPRDTPVLCLADPFTFAADVLLTDHRQAGLPAPVGGLASGGQRAGDHVLFAGRDVHFEGGVVAALPGVHARTLVSQGCVPIGPDMVITAGGGNRIDELAGVPAYEKIMAVLDEERARPTSPSGLVLGGIVVNENVPDYTRGDFLVRAIHGRDVESGGVVVGTDVRVGQTFHLQVRDATTADEDLHQTLRAIRDSTSGAARAALIFTCNGRGRRLFGTPDHDVGLVTDVLRVPTAGMFCNGEIGPVGNVSALHGYSVAMMVFTAAAPGL